MVHPAKHNSISGFNKTTIIKRELIKLPFYLSDKFFILNTRRS